MQVRVLLALLLIKTNFSIQIGVGDGDDDADDDNSHFELATVSSSRKHRKFQQNMPYNTTTLPVLQLRDITNITATATATAQQDITATGSTLARLSLRLRQDVNDMLHAWSWVPKWWQRLRQWTTSTTSVLNKRCTNRNMTSSIGGPLLFCAFLPAMLVTATGQQPEPEPEFLAPLENHTVTQGRDIYFTCVVNHLSSYKVAWIKSDTKAILAIHTHMVAQNPRLSVTHNGHNTWKLHVSNVQKNDSGTYMCQINTDPMRSQMGTLEVVIPPDILNDNDSSEGGGVAVEGGTVRLKCHATGVPEPTVSWRREDSRSLVLRHDGGRDKQVLRSYEGDTLVLSNILRIDMGAYLCIASNGVPPSVSKRFTVRVHFHPKILVSNQLVAAPVDSAVVVQCYVEASPRAMNHWTRDTGEKLIPNEKYAMEETILNEYSLLMNLTIRSLVKRDFGGYVCTSSNALGKADAVVRLQELHLIVKSTSTPSPPRQVDAKPRKILQKDKPKKYKRPTKGRKESSDDREEEDDLESTKVSVAETRTLSPLQTATPGATKPPPWVLHRNVAQLSPQSIPSMVAIGTAILLFYRI